MVSKENIGPQAVLIEIIRMQLKLGEALATVNSRLSKLEITADTLLQGAFQDEFRKHFEADQQSATETQEELKKQIQQVLNALEGYMNG